MRRLLALPMLGALMLPVATGAQQMGADQRQQLDAATRASRAAQARAARLERDSANARNAAERASRQRAAIAARTEMAEADIAVARARISLIDIQLRQQRQRLEAKRAPTTRLVAALQSLARRPASLSLLQPGSARDAVHVRALLAGVVPVVRARSAAVKSDFERVRALRQGARQAAESLREGRARLESDRLRLVQMEAASRLRSRDLARGALAESDRAIALGEEARDIVDRMAVDEAAKDTQARLAALDGPLPRPGEGTGPAFNRTKPYRLPVLGRLIAGLGETSDSGVRSRGLTFAVAPSASVEAPAAGRVVFARVFGGYGTVVILDHGEGWTSLISGLGAATVKRGERAGQGASLGRAPATADPRVTVELRRQGEPFDMVPLLR